MRWWPNLITDLPKLSPCNELLSTACWNTVCLAAACDLIAWLPLSVAMVTGCTGGIGCRDRVLGNYWLVVAPGIKLFLILLCMWDISHDAFAQASSFSVSMTSICCVIWTILFLLSEHVLAIHSSQLALAATVLLDCQGLVVIFQPNVKSFK